MSGTAQGSAGSNGGASLIAPPPPQQQQQQQQSSSGPSSSERAPAASSASGAAAAARPMPSGRPPLPPPLAVPRSVPASLNSSRASSPRSSVSAQPSMHTLSMARLAQYRAGARTLKPDTAPRSSLSSGDCIAFKQEGKFLRVVELPSSAGEAPTTVHYCLQPSEAAGPSDPLTHLEVIKQGKWYGFRSLHAGDRFLQARKRSPNRLVIFSANVGTWEQWELAGGGSDPEAAPWAAAPLVLRHRRLPQFTLTVEAVRVGSYAMHPASALTPRSLLPAGGGAQQEGALEKTELKRMSGVLVHEWLHFVDREKLLRGNLERSVSQLAEDAADLRAWTVLQVESVRREMDEEVSVLLKTIERKSARLADAEARLTGRLRWGVALIQAKGELSMKRQVFAWWRWIAARKKYCRTVEQRLQERAQLRLQGRAFQAWLDWHTEQAALQAKLRAAVRRMSFTKLWHAFAAWQGLVATRKQQAAEQEQRAAAACQHMQRWRLRQVVGTWGQLTARARQGRQLLQRMARQAQQAAVASAFGAWRAHTVQLQHRVSAFSRVAEVRQQQDAQRAPFQAWRLAVDDECGGKLQLSHAQQVLARLRRRHCFQAWLGWQQGRAEQRGREEALVQHMWARSSAITAGAVLGGWQQHLARVRDEQAAFYYAVQQLALRRMAVALQYWRLYTGYCQRVRAAVHAAVERRARRVQARAWAGWLQQVAEARTNRHRVAVGQRRQRLRIQRSVLEEWRQVAAAKAGERSLVAHCQRRADRNRMAGALAALRANVECAALQRQQAAAAAAHHASSLQARALGALAGATDRSRTFQQRLGAVASAQRRALVKAAVDKWRRATTSSAAERQLVAGAQRRFARQRLRACLLAWQAEVDEQQLRAQRLQQCVLRMAQMRMGWVFSRWRHAAEASAAEEQLVAAARRRLARIKLAAAVAGWRQHTAQLAAARQAAEQLAAGHAAALARDCLLGWGEHAAQRAQHHLAIMRFVGRRTAWIQLNVLHVWSTYLQYKRDRRMQLQRAVRRLALVRLQHAFGGWRREVAAAQAEARRLTVAEARIAARQQASALRSAFHAWKQHTGCLAGVRASVEAQRRAEVAVLLRHTFASWSSHAAQQRLHRAHVLRACTSKRSAAAQAGAFAAWRSHTQAQLRNQAVVQHMVARMSWRIMRTALDTWRGAAHERRVRRTSIARFIQRWDTARKAASFGHWRQLLVERAAAQDNLRNCLIRKRVAFRLFRQSYWESFDDDMQDTLRAMFDLTEEAALDPLPSRPGSPLASLLSSPIRSDLYGMSQRQQLQLTVGVAEALGRPGALQPAFLRGGQQQQQQPSSSASGMSGLMSGLPQLAAREPLSARLASAAESPYNPGAQPHANFGGAALAPLRDFAAAALAPGGAAQGKGWGLAPVPEAGESPYAASLLRSPALEQEYRSPSRQQWPAGSGASSAASTALPGTPLTPMSALAGAAGGRDSTPPFTGLTGLATPPTSLVLPEALLGGGATPASGVAARAALLSRTPLGGLSGTPGGGADLAGLKMFGWGEAPPSGSLAAALSEAGTPGSHLSAARSAAYSAARTPQPEFGGSPADLAGEATPLPGSVGGGGASRFELRHFGDASEYAAAAERGTPLSAQRTPSPGLGGDLKEGMYSLRRLDQAAEQEEEGQWLGGERTPHPGELIGAYSFAGQHAMRTNSRNEDELSASKAAMVYFNPVALDGSPMRAPY